MSRKKVLITGGSGFIGTQLSKSLLLDGHDVVILDLLEPKVNLDRLDFLRGDVRNYSDLLGCITSDIDAVFHFAAIVSVTECENNPRASFETNLLGTQNLLNRILELKPTKSIPVFFASSAAVYGNLGKNGTLLNEQAALPQPTSFYGLHKFASEQSIQLFCQRHGLLGISFRFFNVYGSGQNAQSPYSGVISRFKRAFETDESISLFNHGRNSRDFIHVEEIARACKLALKLEKASLNGAVVNLCSGRSLQIKELLELMAKHYGKNPHTKLLPPRDGDIEFSCGDSSKARDLLDFSNTIQLESVDFSKM